MRFIGGFGGCGDGEHREEGRSMGGWRGWVGEVIGHGEGWVERGGWSRHAGGRGRLVFTVVWGVHSDGVGVKRGR